ncbi:hypothetical protein CN162_01485 [Sinorhizobium meliloti]|uniref:hypothetical protein n=1 Tax=Rhizobium meliloti TaxID=382 RepID=UPI000FD8889D|nr:hypothetical protein [Sinorhizobium meliloti]RVK61944.1 hypothetical protein CN162_01485 [Sinorhizobium meliloti]
MAEFTFWPADLLPPKEIAANQVPFTRTGGRTINGLERTIRTDRGFWSISLNGVLLHSKAQRRTWNAVRTFLSGRSGLIIVPVWSWDTAPYASGSMEQELLTTHSDGTPFSDGTLYSQGSIAVRCAATAEIGATTVKLSPLSVEPDLAGVRFSYNHALYETGPAIDISGSVWTVPVFPAVRARIPAGADLEFNLPTCLTHLADDRGMDVSMNPSVISEHSVAFVEATDYWSDLAAGLI